MSGYLVAALVAVVGARFGSALLAVLSGSMVIAVGTALTVSADWTLQPVLLGVQVAFVALASVQAALLLGSIRRAARDDEMTRLVDREIKQRESSAAELVSHIQLRDGTRMICKVSAIQNGATMVSFRNPETAALPASQERFAASTQG